MVEAFWSLEKVARRIGIPPDRLAYAITCGKLPDSKIRLAGRRAFSEAEVQQLAEHFARLPPAKKGEANMSTKVTRLQKKAKKLWKWLAGRTSSFDFGVKTKGGVPHPVHVNNKISLFQCFNGNAHKKRFRLRDLLSHVEERETYYFTGNGLTHDTETLVNFDIDCHHHGTLRGAIEFAEWLKQNHFPGLYYETSTNGNGVHGFVIVTKDEGTSAAQVNAGLRKLQAHLRKLLSQTRFDVQDVEIKGMCPELTWNESGLLTCIKMGSLAKIPREIGRFEELTSTARLTLQSLLDLPEPTTSKAMPTAAIYEFPKRRVGSVSGRVISDEEVAKLTTTYRAAARKIMPPTISLSSGSQVIWEDMAVFLMLLRQFTGNANADGSMPMKRFEGMWKALIRTGEVSRSCQPNRLACLRNHLSDKGYVNWTDSAYTPGFFDETGEYRKGKACKWRATEGLLSLLVSIESEEEKKTKDDQEEQQESISLTSLPAEIQKAETEEEASLALGISVWGKEAFSTSSKTRGIRPVLTYKQRQWNFTSEEIVELLPSIETSWQMAA